MTDQTTTPTVSEAQELADDIEKSSSVHLVLLTTNGHSRYLTGNERATVISALRAMPEAQGWRPTDTSDVPFLIGLSRDTKYDSTHEVIERSAELARCLRLSDEGLIACEQHAKGIIPHITRLGLRRLHEMGSPLPAPPPQEVK